MVTLPERGPDADAGRPLPASIFGPQRGFAHRWRSNVADSRNTKRLLVGLIAVLCLQFAVAFYWNEPYPAVMMPGFTGTPPTTGRRSIPGYRVVATGPSGSAARAERCQVLRWSAALVPVGGSPVRPGHDPCRAVGRAPCSPATAASREASIGRRHVGVCDPCTAAPVGADRSRRLGKAPDRGNASRSRPRPDELRRLRPSRSHPRVRLR